MSEHETLKGTLKLRPRLKNEIDEDYFKRITGCEWTEYKYDPENINDAIGYHSLHDKFIEVDDQIYEIIELQDIMFGCFCDITKDGDKIHFITSFYNGGTCLSEMLEEAIQKNG